MDPHYVVGLKVGRLSEKRQTGRVNTQRDSMYAKLPARKDWAAVPAPGGGHRLEREPIRGQNLLRLGLDRCPIHTFAKLITADFMSVHFVSVNDTPINTSERGKHGFQGKVNNLREEKGQRVRSEGLFLLAKP